MGDLTQIRNIGPAMAESFVSVGITSASQLRDMGPDEAYARLLDHGRKPHFIPYYALVMGLQGRPWNDCKGAEKEALRARFDAICARAAPDIPPGIEQVLNEIGTGLRR